MANVYRILEALTLATHLAWIGWVIFGALLTRGRRGLTWFHVISLVWGIVVEAGPWPCPLTLVEQWLRAKAGGAPYAGGFIVHYLEAVVYPDVPERVLTWCGVGVCLFNLLVYARRWWRPTSRL